MNCEEPEFLTDNYDFTTLFYVIFRSKSSRWLTLSVESDFKVYDVQYGALT